DDHEPSLVLTMEHVLHLPARSKHAIRSPLTERKLFEDLVRALEHGGIDDSEVSGLRHGGTHKAKTPGCLAAARGLCCFDLSFWSVHEPRTPQQRAPVGKPEEERPEHRARSYTRWCGSTQGSPLGHAGHAPRGSSLIRKGMCGLAARPRENELGRCPVYGVGANRALQRVEIRRVAHAFELVPSVREALGDTEALRLVSVARLLQELVERAHVPPPERDVAFLLHAQPLAIP